MIATERRDDWRRIGQLGTAAVWLHQGLWCKVLGRDATHRDVIASIPGLSDRAAGLATTALGVGESMLAVLVATNGHRRWVAGVETALVAGFNAGGLAVGRGHIDHPGRLLARNGLFVTLIWSAAR